MPGLLRFHNINLTSESLKVASSIILIDRFFLTVEIEIETCVILPGIQNFKL
jgi:hypothetical protein